MFFSILSSTLSQSKFLQTDTSEIMFRTDDGPPAVASSHSFTQTMTYWQPRCNSDSFERIDPAVEIQHVLDKHASQTNSVQWNREFLRFLAKLSLGSLDEFTKPTEETPRQPGAALSSGVVETDMPTVGGHFDPQGGGYL